MTRSLLSFTRRICNERITFIRPSLDNKIVNSPCKGPTEKLTGFMREHLNLDSQWQIFLTSSGRSAFRMALEAFRAEKSDCFEVIIPSYGCRGIFEPVRECGLTPVWVDIDSNLLPDQQDILKKITNKTLCVLAHNILGMAAPTEELRNHCNKLGIFILDDNCQSLGINRHPSCENIILSFGVSKTLGIGAGGAFLTKKNTENICKIYEGMPTEDARNACERYNELSSTFLNPFFKLTKIRIKGFQGFADSAFSRQYDFQRISYPDLAMLEKYLPQLKSILSKNYRNHERLFPFLEKIPGARLVTKGATGERAVLLFDSVENLENFANFMFSRNIEVEKLYRPLHQRFGGSMSVVLPVTDRYAPLALSLPTRANLSGRELKRMESAIKNYCNLPTTRV